MEIRLAAFFGILLAGLGVGPSRAEPSSTAALDVRAEPVLRELADLKPEPALWGVLALRLAAAPLLAILLVQAAARVGLVIPDAPRQIFYLVAAMPIAISCTLFTERYGGDSLLSAKAILASTLASLATVPLLFRLIQSQGW